MYSFVSIFFCSALCFWDLPVVCVTDSLPCSHLLYKNVTVYSSVLILIDIWVVCDLEHLQRMLQWTYVLIIGHLYLWMESWVVELCICLTYMDNAKLFAKVVFTNVPASQYCMSVTIVSRSSSTDLTSHQEYMKIVFVTYLVNIWYYQIFICF